MKYKCPKCGDIVEPKRIYHEIQRCKCEQLGIDWVTGTEDRFRILGKYEKVET
jgi:ribosomal protein L37AE/L43A